LVISPLYQAYGDSSFKDCKQASEEAIANVIKNLQVYFYHLIVLFRNGFISHISSQGKYGLFSFQIIILLYPISFACGIAISAHDMV